MQYTHRTFACRNTNGASNGLSMGHLNNVPNESSGSVVDRFSQSNAAEEPYFARARMEDRSDHVSRLSSQLNATDEIMKK